MLNTFLNNTLTNTITYFDPLEQFEIKLNEPISSLPFEILHFSNIYFLYAFLYSLLYISFSHFFTLSNSKFSGTRLVFNNLYTLVKTTLQNNTLLKRYEYFAIFFYLFIFILCSNLIGLIPFSYTITSSFMVTFWLAASYFVGINIIGIWKRNWEIFGIFFANGVPLLIAPLLVPIELISYIARIFSLSIRLFANMLSGHALLKILISFTWALTFLGLYGITIALIPWVIITAITILEMIIAFLQAYVFITLLSVYVNDVTMSH